MPKTNIDKIMADSDKMHELYKSRGGEYGYTGGFMNRGPLRAIDNELWEKCRVEVTGCKTLTERVERYRMTPA